MALQLIDLTTPQPGGKFGDPTKTAWEKANDNFVEISEWQDGKEESGIFTLPSALSAADGAALVGYAHPKTGASLRTLADRSEEVVYADDFGARGDGEDHPLSERFETLSAAQAVYPFVTSLTQTQDWAGWQAAANSQRRVRAREDKVYVWNDTLMADDTNLFLDGGGAMVVDAAGDKPLVFARANYGLQVVVNSISVENVDYTEGNTGGATRTNVLNVTSTAGFAVGDRVKVISDDLLEESRPADQERKGEHAVIGAIHPGKLCLLSLLFEQYNTNVRVAKQNADMRVDISKLRTVSRAPGNQPVVRLQGTHAARVVDVIPLASKSAVVETISCVATETDSFAATNAHTNFVGEAAYGYALVEYASEFGRHSNHYAENVRHLYTDGTLIAIPGDTRTERYGRTKGSRISNCTARFCQNAPYDTHWSSHGILFLGCVAYAPFNGPNASQRGVQLRGQAAVVDSCITYGGTGVSVFQGTASPLSGANNVVRGHTHFFLPGIQGRAAIDVTGDSSLTTPTMTLVVDGLKTVQPGWASSDIAVARAQSDTFPHINVTRAVVRLSNFDLQAKQGGSFSACVLQAGAYGTIIAKCGNISSVGAAGQGIRVCKQLAGSTVRLEDVTLEGSWHSLVDAQNTLGISFSSERVNATAPLANAAGYTNVPADDTTARLSVDYTVGFRKTNRAALSQSYTSGGIKTVLLSNNGAPRLVFTGRVGVSGGNTRIGAIDRGAFDGQMLVVRNNSTSLDFLSIEAGVTDPEVTTTLAVGESQTLMWSEALTKWMKI